MEHRRSKLALFFVAQALGVTAMILLLRRGAECSFSNCELHSASIGSATVTVLVIVGELWILAQALRADGPVWRTVLALGILALIAAPLAVLLSRGLRVSPHVVRVAVFWHLAGGLLLMLTGAAGGVGELLARLRRSDDAAGDDRGSSAMWPLD